MPELPEVETIRRGLNKELQGKKILELWWDAPKMLQPSAEQVKKAVVGQTFEQVERRAKLLIFHLSNGQRLLIHLKLSGRLLFRDGKDPADDYVHVKFVLSGGKELRFAEARKFGYVKLVDEAALQEILGEYGPEPFDDLTLEKFREVIGKRKIAIKKLLMDQKVISGVGNIYANDALWLAQIHPGRLASSLTAAETQRLFAAIESVLKEGLATGGASDQWYRNAYGGEGHYQEHFKVYGRVGEPCPKCGGVIEREVLGGRGTFFCPKCQPVRGVDQAPTSGLSDKERKPRLIP